MNSQTQKNQKTQENHYSNMNEGKPAHDAVRDPNPKADANPGENPSGDPGRPPAEVPNQSPPNEVPDQTPSREVPDQTPQQM